MTRLLGGQIGLDDFLFAHVKGEKKSVVVCCSIFLFSFDVRLVGFIQKSSIADLRHLLG
jgi:hypothetical protein